MSHLLEVQDLNTSFHLSSGILPAVTGVDFSLAKEETLAIVGESGCGKSVTAYSIMRLIAPPGIIVSGRILLEGTDLLQLSDNEMQGVRGNLISMIFQEPMTSLNPVLRIGKQIIEGLMLHRKICLNDAREEGIKLLSQVGIPSSANRFDDYPHQLSGGMRQRVMIAMALACRPKILIADEPTTALDVTIQAQILELIDQLRYSHGMALILITHDLGIVAERSNRLAIMYAGKIVEYAKTADLFGNPLHPYTKGLILSLPQNAEPGRPIKTIRGLVPNLINNAAGCLFVDRCPVKFKICHEKIPGMVNIGADHFVRCWKYA